MATSTKPATPKKSAATPATAAPKKAAAKPAAPKKAVTAPKKAASPAKAAVKPKTVGRAAKAKPAASPEQRGNYIEVAAYYIAERRGFAPGDPLEDWAQAEAEIDRLLAEGKLNV
jgi:hypothetical protein